MDWAAVLGNGWSLGLGLTDTQPPPGPRSEPLGGPAACALTAEKPRGQGALVASAEEMAGRAPNMVPALRQASPRRRAMQPWGGCLLHTGVTAAPGSVVEHAAEMRRD